MHTIGEDRPPRKIPLSADEREVIVTFNDAEKLWRVYSDSATMRGTILRLARQVGAEVRWVGSHGVEFAVPADALRLSAKRETPGTGGEPANPRSSRDFCTLEAIVRGG